MKLLSSFLLVLFVFSSTVASAQINPEKKAKKLSQKMQKALDLSEKETQDIYEMQYNRFVKANEITDEYAGQPDVIRQKRKALGKDIYNQLKNYLGKERLKEWREWRKQNK